MDSIEQNTLSELARDSLIEQRRARRWKIFFRFTYLLIAALIFFTLTRDNGSKNTGPHTAVVDVNGVIASGAPANAYDVIEGLERAFSNKNVKGIIIRINSPGGSPVQSELINQEIRRLRSLNAEMPVYAVVEDICASGGYYVAVAVDQIYVAPSSIVGSIGVRMDGFEFTEALDSLGIKRRLLTAGENKAFLDPFSPMKPAQQRHAKSILDNIHKQFIDAVTAGRGERLQQNPDIFSGLVWTGEQSIELGLVDGYGSVLSVSRDIIGAQEVINYSIQEGFGERIVRKFGAEILYKTMGYNLY
ncbi:signal peptide peptidase SppA [Burkholderiales bacterium]|nr:signal peptide peptidase SppA [Burkholderiales bacterium]